jgi:D-serine deaminase-like pyridoxal phosphate-dependent protein
VTLEQLSTPAALIELARMQQNIDRMQQRMDELGVRFRPHVKTSKCLPVVEAQIKAGARGITVSTLKEAEQFFAAGVSDILYAVSMAPSKLPQALALRRKGCNLVLLTENSESAQAIGAFGKEQGEMFDILIEIDTDGHRSGLKPDDDRLLGVAAVLERSGMNVAGVMTHAGSSYALNTPKALEAMAEQERQGCVHAALRLRDAGFQCPIVSVGSTPTALSARSLDGVTEVRAGVYVFFDLVMCNIGVCTDADVALSVLTTVIGHQPDKGWAIVDAGWMAMSQDRGTRGRDVDYGYGQVCTLDGTPIKNYIMSAANQEHGIISCSTPTDDDILKKFPVGSLLRILPNHACATAAQFPNYQALGPDGGVTEWSRFYGW